MSALERLMESKIFIDDTPGITLTEMRAKARRLQQRKGSLDLIMIDYLQLMTALRPGEKRFENRKQEVAAVSRGLKALAKEIKVPVIALSQLSRASEQRGGDKKPMLSDLRESGSIEQDADVVASSTATATTTRTRTATKTRTPRARPRSSSPSSATAPRARYIWPSRRLHALRESAERRRLQRRLLKRNRMLRDVLVHPRWVRPHITKPLCPREAIRRTNLPV